MNSIIGSASFVLILCSTLSTALAADVVETAEKSSEIRAFAVALRDARVADSLKATGPYTVFAPSNAAFDKLDPNTRDSLFKNKESLSDMLLRHIIPGKVLVAEVKPGAVKTLQGTEVRLKSDNGKITVDDANVTLSDIEADNGVIHIIDTVLLPAK